jgi:Flp pilus assembly protein TadD
MLLSPTAAEERAFGVEMAIKGLWKEALFRFERAVALDPGDARALNNLAIALEQSGDFDGARAAYQNALKRRPKDDSIQQNFDLFMSFYEKRERQLKKRRTIP